MSKVWMYCQRCETTFWDEESRLEGGTHPCLHSQHPARHPDLHPYLQRLTPEHAANETDYLEQVVRKSNDKRNFLIEWLIAQAKTPTKSK